MPIDPEDLRSAMRHWTTGVTVVSSVLGDRQHGMTASSFTSVSLDPPLVLVSLERITNTHLLVQEAGTFAVTILESNQQAISDRFAGRESENSDRFAGLDTYTMVTGAPLLSGGLAAFDCRVVSHYEAGTHTVFIGEVEAVRYSSDGSPLLYYDRDYRTLRK